MFDSQDPVEEIKTLTKEEAAVVIASNPSLNPWRVVFWQVCVVAVSALVAWLLTQRLPVVYSLVWGGLSVVIPAALFARGLMSRATLMNAGSAVMGFLLWEMVKIGLTLAMLFVSMRVVQDLSWPSLLIGLVVTMKVYWLALLCKPKVSKAGQN